MEAITVYPEEQVDVVAVLALDVSDVPGDLRHLVEDRVEAEGSSSHRPIDGPPEIVNGRQGLKFTGKGLHSQRL